MLHQSVNFGRDGLRYSKVSSQNYFGPNELRLTRLMIFFLFHSLDTLKKELGEDSSLKN